MRARSITPTKLTTGPSSPGLQRDRIHTKILKLVQALPKGINGGLITPKLRCKVIQMGFQLGIQSDQWLKIL